MLPIDPGDGQGSVTPARPLTDILPAPAMAHGGTTIIRPGVVAWGGLRDSRDQGTSSGEAIERSIGAVARDAGQLPGLLAELTRTRLWVPLPLVRDRPFTDGTAVLLPLVRLAGIDFVPCFTSVGRLTAWADAIPARAAGIPEAGAGGRRWRRAGDARVVPHIVVAAVGLARRLPAGLGLALNPDAAPGVPLYPECVSYLARLTPPGPIPAQRRPDPPLSDPRRPDPRRPDIGMLEETAPPAVVVGHPPAEPTALLRAAEENLRALPTARHAARAWLSVPGRDEGLVISVALDDPSSEQDRYAVVDALTLACASVPLRVPFPVDVTFPGEDVPGEPAASVIDDWIARNTRPFYIRDSHPRT